ncbi:DUF1178 family protein [Croceicoccus ponticola]|uniref:DUF1178 family protein n=1 Tax=Croceicoccus ponticola TaxID=2217664 RepID=A0A437H0H8_9SPHN|nr:DUF1178 family protein [Croceicoccus ponticola]RVQ69076.1 DUF1178 family protein [Croceicoccus ponticola]
MIVFDLSCRNNGHRFEGWFRSSSDFERQQDNGLLLCPECGSANIEKAVMAPAVGRKGNQVPDMRVETAEKSQADAPVPVAQVATVTPEMRMAVETLVRMQKAALEKSRWVGGGFADEARAMHYGEREAEAIHGQATTDEIEDLIDEGVDITPLPFPVAPPDIVN